MAQAETRRSGLPALIAGERVRQATSEAVRPGLYPEAAFEAQLLGQPLQRRGLRGGAEVLNKAAGAYLSAEYAGEADRRPAPGLIRVREI